MSCNKGSNDLKINMCKTHAFPRNFAKSLFSNQKDTPLKLPNEIKFYYNTCIPIPQCRNLINLLSLIFYVKSNLGILKVQNLPFQLIWRV